MAFSKKSLALGLAGILTVAATTPSFAQRWEPWAAGAAGFAAGAAVGSAAARGYGPGGYAYGPGYAYAPGFDAYAYQPGDAYAYQPGMAGPAYGNYYGSGQYGHYDSGFKDCATDGQYNRTDYSAC